jgi:hypothetical protein
MFSAGAGSGMSRTERAIAAFLLAIAVAGGGLLPRLLSAPPNRIGIAFGPSPGRSIVRTPAIPGARHRAPWAKTTPAEMTPHPAAPVTLASPPARKTAPAEPAPAAPRTPAPIHRSAPAPPPPAPTATSAGGFATPAPAADPPRRGRSADARAHIGDESRPTRLESGHGRFPQAPPIAVGADHRGVGHLAPPAAGAAPAAHEAGAEARSEARIAGRAGGPPAPLAHHR